MIVRISGQGQYELDDDAVKRLDELDTRLTAALGSDAAAFRAALQETVQFIEQSGTPVADERVVPSDVIVPPADVDLEEAKNFFTDEGLMDPLPA
jgi:hypothetical protein